MQPNGFQVIVWHTTIYDPIVLQYIFALLPIYISQKRWDWLILKFYVHQYIELVKKGKGVWIVNIVIQVIKQVKTYYMNVLFTF
jgi:hypothetical protein